MLFSCYIALIFRLKAIWLLRSSMFFIRNLWTYSFMIGEDSTRFGGECETCGLSFTIGMSCGLGNSSALSERVERHERRLPRMLTVVPPLSGPELTCTISLILFVIRSPYELDLEPPLYSVSDLKFTKLAELICSIMCGALRSSCPYLFGRNSATPLITYA